jgi:hypothetical protein
MPRVKQGMAQARETFRPQSRFRHFRKNAMSVAPFGRWSYSRVLQAKRTRRRNFGKLRVALWV